MNTKQILEELKSMGALGIKKVLLNHGAKEPFFGVKVGDMKKIVSRVKKDYKLALDLYDTGIYDAMYLAGLIADDANMTAKDLRHWASTAYCSALATSTVAWVTAGSPHGHDLALEWIEAKDELVAAAGWATLRSLVSIKPDAELDLAELKRLLSRVHQSIHQQPDEVRSAMNHFVIAVGTCVKPLSGHASQIGEKIGKVSVDVGGTSCSVPYAPDSIEKARKRGTLGVKRKSAKC